MAGILKVDQIKATGSGGIVEIPSGTTLYPPGHVIQTLNTYMPTQVESSMSSWTDLNFDQSITPSSLSSKVLVTVQMAGCGTRDTSTQGRLALYRGSTLLAYFADYIGSSLASGSEAYPGITWMDSPATTSATTYEVKAIRATGSANVYINHYRGGSTDDPQSYAVSTMTVMEIAQ